MELRAYIQQRFDQADEDDRLIGPDAIDSIIDRCRILDVRELHSLLDQKDGVEFSEASHIATFTMIDFFSGETLEELDRTSYYFRPAFLLHPGNLRVYVGGTLQEEHNYEFDPVRFQLDFDARLGSDAVVTIKAHLVNWRDIVAHVLDEMLSVVLATPDIYGSKAAEWERRIEGYKARHTGARVYLQ